VEPAPHPRRPSGHCHTLMPPSHLNGASTAGTMIHKGSMKDRVICPAFLGHGLLRFHAAA